MLKIMIVGGGAGGTALLPILNDYSEIEITGVADINPDAPGIRVAKQLDVPTGTDFHELLGRIDANIIINVSGQASVSEELDVYTQDGRVEVIEGVSARFLFKLVDERRSREEEALGRLKEQEALYKIGIMLSSSESEDELLNTILECATGLTDTPAGSIALYNEEEGRMELVATSGFSEGFIHKTKWPVRPGGLTEYILNESKPVVIGDLDQFHLDRKDSAQLLKSEGIKSLIALPLVADRKVKGILYVDDFEVREFSRKDQSILALLSTQAAIAIEKMQLYERVKKLADTDGLTGLFNHRYFVKRLREEIKRTKRFGHPLSVLIMDVDHFKHYNDTNGHLKGNSVLQGVAEVMQQTIRKVDILARYGGEEFAIIIPEAGQEEALKTAQRICNAIEQRIFEGEETQPMNRLTVSIGVASYPDDATREGSLLDRADHALYQAKHAGRNRAVAFGQNL